MPSVEDWVTRPLNVVQNLYDSRDEKNQETPWITEVYKYFSTKLDDEANQKLVPYLNDKLSHEQKKHSLVRFRCMVQDNFGPEYFLAKEDGEGKCCFFQDGVFKNDDGMENGDCMEIGGSLASRNIYYCVAIPGETAWVKQNYHKRDPTPSSSGRTCGVKRVRDDDEEEAATMETEQNADGDNKKRKLEESKSALTQPKPLTKNHPLPGENGTDCIVKVYDEFPQQDSLLPNKMYDFFGVLSMEPTPCLDSLKDEVGADMIDEYRAHSPPSSFTPRLHCVAVYELKHNNYMLPEYKVMEGNDFAQFKDEAANLYEEMISLMKKATLGDELAARYLLIHLVSRVSKFEPKDTPIGKMVLNLGWLPENSGYSRFLAQFIEQFVTKLFYFPMTLKNMNELKFAPRKNYQTMRLETGMLQMPENLYFVVDETRLSPGQLKEQGVVNLRALNHLFKTNHVEYDFQFHRIPYMHTPVTLVLSEGKSMLPCDVAVRLRPQDPMPEDLDQYLSTCLTEVSKRLDAYRNYLTAVSFHSFQPSPEVYEFVQEDFVSTRQQSGPDAFTVDDLNMHISILKCMINLLGITPNNEHWKEIRALEKERKDRIRST